MLIFPFSTEHGHTLLDFVSWTGFLLVKKVFLRFLRHKSLKLSLSYSFCFWLLFFPSSFLKIAFEEKLDAKFSFTLSTLIARKNGFSNPWGKDSQKKFVLSLLLLVPAVPLLPKKSGTDPKATKSIEVM